MLMNLVLGLAVMVFCLFVQALLMAVAVQFYGRHLNLAGSPSFFQTVMVTAGVMLVLVLGNFLQISIWAYLFLHLGEFQLYIDAVYHSAVNFATLGYGDIVMTPKHRILGPMESVNGVLMIGVTTAVMMSVLQDALKRTRDARKARRG